MSAVEKDLIKRFLIPFAIAICAVAGGVLLRLFVTGDFGPGLPPYITFYPAVMLAAIWGGFLAGLMATTISALIVFYWLIPPIGEFTIATRLDAIGLILFLAMGVFMSGLAELYRRNRRKAAAYDCETAVRESQARLAMFAEATFEGIAEIEAGRIVDCNEQFTRMLGYSVAELKGLEITTLIVPADSDRLMSSLREHRDSAIELTMIHKDGTRVIAETHSRPLSHVSSRSYLVLRDLTGRRHAEAALRQSESRLRRFYESGLLGVIYWNMSGEITDGNDKFLEMVGYDREDLKAGRIDWSAMTPSEYRHLDEQSVRELKATGVNKKPFEKEYIRKDGTRIPIIMASAMLDEARFNGVAFLLDITERKQVESKLRESEQGLSALYSSMTEGVAQHELIYDSGGQVIDYVIRDVNPAFETITGLSKDIIVNKKASEIYGTGNPPYLDTYSRVALSRQAVSFESYFPPMEKYFQISVFSTAHGKFATVFEDISERKKAADVLHTTVQRFFAVLSSMYASILLVGDNGRIEFANQAFCDFFDLKDSPAGLTGLTAPEMIEKIKNAYLHPNEEVSRIREIVGRGQPVKGEEIAMRGDRTCLRDFVPIGVDGKSYGRLWLHTEITERKRAEMERQRLLAVVQSERDRLMALVNSMTDEIWFADADKKVALVNPAVWKEFGSSIGDAKEVERIAASLEVYRPDGTPRPVDEAPLLRALRGETVMAQEEIIRTPATGQLRHRQVNAAPVRNHDGVILGSLSVVRDITERKRAEEELRLAYGRLQTFFDHRIGGIGIVIANAKGDILQANDYYLSLLGYTREEVFAGQVDWRRMTPPEWLPADERALSQLREQSVCETYEKEYARRDGSRVPVLITDAMMPGDGGDILAFVLDITERKRAEEALQKAKDELEERVQERTEDLAKSQERLQHIASQLLLAQEKERKRVAVELHDGLLSELAAIKYLLEGKLMLLEKGTSVDVDGLRRIADILVLTMKEARRIMNNLHPSVLDELGLIAAMNWLCGENQKSYPHIKVETKIGVTEGDISESIRVVIFRVLQEALNNFAKHGNGDRVEVSLSKADGVFELMIRDNGQGFDVKKAPKGLGLESMRERVELSGGEFRIESAIGQGTTIRATWSL